MEKGYAKKYWREVVSQSFKAAWKRVEMKAAIIATCAILIPIAILGLLTFAGIVPLHIFTDQAKNALSGLFSFCGSIIILLVLFLVMIYRTPAEMNHKKNQTIRGLQKKFKEPPEIEKLAKLRTEGVALRNTGERLASIADLHTWIDNYRNWDTKVLNILGKLSKGKAEWLRTLNRMPLYKFSNVLDSEHARFLRILEEKLRRLEIILGQYLDLPDL
jgi:hypothetical protein